MAGISGLIWRISVALYLVANGVMGTFLKSGDFGGIFGNNILTVIAGIIALIAGIMMLLELFKISVPIVDLLIFILAIVWCVFAVYALIRDIGNGVNLWAMLSGLGVRVMISASLLVASKKFGG